MFFKLLALVVATAPAAGNVVQSTRLARKRQGHDAHGHSRMRLIAGDDFGDNDRSAMKNRYPWYHTTEELRSEASRLASSCSTAMTLRTVNQSGVSIDVARLRKPGPEPANRVFIIFGEHSRELIGPESGLQLLRVLCGEAAPSEGSPSAADVLQDSEFEIVLNGNPRSRPKVETGDFCLRTNPDGVDLNRNWDEMWQTSEATASSSVYPGPRPFSEPETRVIRELVSEYKPTTFLTVHSGTRGMYMPWAYDTEHLAERNQPQMLKLLRTLDEGHCQCPYGAAGKEVGYSCPGTSLDWVYDKLRTPYSFAFEIYTSPDRDRSLRERWESKVQTGGQALLEEGHHLGHPHFLDLFQSHASDFVHTAQSHDAGSEDMEADSCFTMFNPDTKERYDATVQNWASVYMEMSQHVARSLRTSQAANTTVH